jgi:phosphoadenosine phosphosulfate reductase
VTTALAEELTDAAERLDRAPAEEIVAWAVQRFGDGLVLAASFQDCVLIDVAVQVAPAIEVVFLNTQYHFPETLAYVEQVRARYDLNLRVAGPRIALDDRWRLDADACCRLRKVEPLNRALEGKTSWLSGLRRAESPTRADAPVVGWDLRRGVAKINPLATWTDGEVDAYVAARGLPEHPLRAAGFASIGCWPCTRSVRPGDDPRAGRWAGTAKTECGLHSG